jgi:hypothetical protein
MQVVYVLGHQQKLVAQTLFQFGQGDVGGVGFVFRQALSQKIVEVLDPLGVTPEGVGGANVLDILVFPHAVVPAEGAES